MLRISRPWGCIQHRNKLPRLLSVQITYAVASRIGLNSRSGACRKHGSVDNGTQWRNQTASHPTNPRISHSTCRRPTSFRYLFSSQSSGRMSYDSEKAEPTMLFMKCASTSAFAVTFSTRRRNMLVESGTTLVPIPQSRNVKQRWIEPQRSTAHHAMRCWRFQIR